MGFLSDNTCLVNVSILSNEHKSSLNAIMLSFLRSKLIVLRKSIPLFILRHPIITVASTKYGDVCYYYYYSDLLDNYSPLATNIFTICSPIPDVPPVITINFPDKSFLHLQRSPM